MGSCEGRSFPRIEALLTSSHRRRWSESAARGSSKAQNPLRETETSGDTQKASIGVLVVLRLWVEGADREPCWARMGLDRPKPRRAVERGESRTSPLWSMPRIILSPAAIRRRMARQRSASKQTRGSGTGSPADAFFAQYRKCWDHTVIRPAGE